ncbi:hypothetical protein JOM56_012381 [Amanita muscaria]
MSNISGQASPPMVLIKVVNNSGFRPRIRSLFLDINDQVQRRPPPPPPPQQHQQQQSQLPTVANPSTTTWDTAPVLIPVTQTRYNQSPRPDAPISPTPQGAASSPSPLMMGTRLSITVLVSIHPCSQTSSFPPFDSNANAHDAGGGGGGGPGAGGAPTPKHPPSSKRAFMPLAHTQHILLPPHLRLVGGGKRTTMAGGQVDKLRTGSELMKEAYSSVPLPRKPPESGDQVIKLKKLIRRFIGSRVLSVVCEDYGEGGRRVGRLWDWPSKTWTDKRARLRFWSRHWSTGANYT